MSDEEKEHRAYVQEASKVDVFMGKVRHAQAKGLACIEADDFIFNHFVGGDYKLDMFCMQGLEVYRTGKTPPDKVEK